MMKIVYMTILLICLSIHGKGFNSNKVGQNNISLELKIDFLNKPAIKRKFLFFGKKELLVSVKIINNTNKNIYVENIIENATLRFIITNEKGKNIQVNIPRIVDPKIDKNYFKIISPKGTLMYETDLLKQNDYNFCCNGYYYISAIYIANKSKCRKNKNIDVFFGKLISNKLVLKQ